MADVRIVRQTEATRLPSRNDYVGLDRHEAYGRLTRNMLAGKAALGTQSAVAPWQ